MTYQYVQCACAFADVSFVDSIIQQPPCPVPLARAPTASLSTRMRCGSSQEGHCEQALNRYQSKPPQVTVTQTRRGGAGDSIHSMSLECLFSITPLPRLGSSRPGQRATECGLRLGPHRPARLRPRQSRRFPCAQTVGVRVAVRCRPRLLDLHFLHILLSHLRLHQLSSSRPTSTTAATCGSRRCRGRRWGSGAVDTRRRAPRASPSTPRPGPRRSRRCSHCWMGRYRGRAPGAYTRSSIQCSAQHGTHPVTDRTCAC
jgi:hypothetical protein